MGVLWVREKPGGKSGGQGERGYSSYHNEWTVKCDSPTMTRAEVFACGLLARLWLSERREHEGRLRQDRRPAAGERPLLLGRLGRLAGKPHKRTRPGRRAEAARPTHPQMVVPVRPLPYLALHRLRRQPPVRPGLDAVRPRARHADLVRGNHHLSV